MEPKIKIKIIVPANTREFNKRIRKAVEPVRAPDMRIDVENIKGGMPHIQSRYDLAINAPYVIELAKDVQKEYDGIFVTDFDMCGVEAVREVVDIPVIGGFRASAYTAMMIAQTFSIVTIMGSVAAMQAKHPREFGITQNFASIRPINVPVDKLSDLKVVIPRVFEESEKAIEEDGAEVIILGCTGFIGVAEPVARLLEEAKKPAPVVDPNRAAISYLELLIRNRLSQSRLTYYPVGT